MNSNRQAEGYDECNAAIQQTMSLLESSGINVETLITVLVHNAFCKNFAAQQHGRTPMCADMELLEAITAYVHEIQHDHIEALIRKLQS